MIKEMLLAAVLSGASILAQTAAENALPADPDKAWQEVEAASQAPAVPKEWSDLPPTKEQRERFEKVLGEQSAAAAAKAREFQARFPDHAKAGEAKARADFFTQQAIRFGNKTVQAEVEASLTEEEKIELKLNEVHRRAMDKRDEGVAAVLAEFEAGLREVMKAYPASPLPWQQMLAIAYNAELETQKRVLAEVAGSKVADEETVARAKGMLKAIGALGRPLELSFTATDGRKVDIQKLKGKVVLVDFWATWCPPCMASLPEVVDLYKRYRDKGFEIVGISLDKSRQALQDVTARHKITWPQYFDGKGWGNQFVIEYNITEVPTMWLVDKAGILRTMQAGEDLEKKVRELLAEKL